MIHSKGPTSTSSKKPESKSIQELNRSKKRRSDKTVISGEKSDQINLSEIDLLKVLPENFRFIDFCAGLGSGHEAAKLEGGVCVGFSEICQKAKVTYKALHDVKTELDLGNLTKIIPANLPDFDLMIGGFPCQSFSILGKRRGFLDPRGKIITYLAEILSQKQPNAFILENVKGLLRHDDGKTLSTVLMMLDKAGYKTTYRVLSSTFFGIPQIRERIYLVGIKKSLNSKFEFNFSSEKVRPLALFLTDRASEQNVTNRQLASISSYLKNKYNRQKYTISDLMGLPDFTVIDLRQTDIRIYKNVVPTLRAGRQGLLYRYNGCLRNISGIEALKLQGFSESKTNKINHIRNSNLLRQAGNAFTVQAIQTLIKKLK